MNQSGGKYFFVNMLTTLKAGSGTEFPVRGDKKINVTNNNIINNLYYTLDKSYRAINEVIFLRFLLFVNSICLTDIIFPKSNNYFLLAHLIDYYSLSIYPKGRPI